MIEKQKGEIEKFEKEDKGNKVESIMEASKEVKSKNKTSDIVLNSNLNLTNMKKDLIRFKDEILKDLKKQQTKILEKDKDIQKNSLEQLEEFNKKMEKYSE